MVAADPAGATAREPRVRYPHTMEYRLLALDLDGTVLAPGGELRPAVRRGIQRAARRAEVVLCTGRRMRTTVPVLEDLALSGEVVLHNGVLVKDILSRRTVRPRFLPPDVYAAALALLSQIGPPLVYVDTFDQGIDITTQPAEQAHPYQRAYLEDAQPFTRFVPSLAERPQDAVILMSLMADDASLMALREQIHAELGDQVATNLIQNKNYQGSILEIVAAGTSKWEALSALARRRGIAAKEILAVGDDVNDAEMVANAGLGVAMGNAVPALKAVADITVPSHTEDGLLEVLEEYFG